MPRQNLTAEFKNFVKGIITEVTPLTFPDNASLDEANFVLNRDGSRERRFGLDLEDGFVKHSVEGNQALIEFSSYRWIDGKGVGAGDIIVIQSGNLLRFFDGGVTDISANLLSEEDLSVSSADEDQSVTTATYARIGKFLVVAFGGAEISSFSYEEGSITREDYRLKIRDFFGVDDFDTDGTDLTEDIGLTRRPSVRTDSHIYNLRNQSWGQKFTSKATGSYADPLATWKGIYTEYPSNNDITTRAVYADTGDSSSRTLERFWETNLHNTDYGTGEPPRGAFIIDFVNRGASRLTQVNLLESEKGLSFPVTSLPSEYEDSSAKSIAAYSGRIFYSGFPGGYSENSKSPNTESFVLFTQLIRSGSEFGKCYQEGDPTSKESADLLATDGGYIQVEDAYNIHTLITTSFGLIVLAVNGVWLIAGGSGYGFSADNFIVKRISDKGSISTSSVIKADDTVLFWGEEGIFQTAPNQYGDLVVTNITKQTIQTLYNNIPYEQKERCYGIYDPYESKLRWVYGERFATSGQTQELVLDTTLGAFSKNTYNVYANHSVLMPIAVPPYTITEDQELVTASSVVVTAGGADVFTTNPLRDTGLRGVRYLALETTSDTEAEMTLSILSNSAFKDWFSVDSVGTDAAAYLLTGYFSGGDIMRKKQVNNLLTYFRRSETGFEEDVESGDWFPVNPSSCLISSHWDWTDDIVAGRWSAPIQAYRIKRPYFPSSLEDAFSNGEPVIVTKSKLRGRGRVVSLKIESEEEKDMQLLGWAMTVGLDGAV
jgi:hypothetical protein